MERKRNGASKRNGEQRTIRWGVVGLGHITQAAVLPAFDNAENCELVALISGDDEKLVELEDKYDVEHLITYDEYEEFLGLGLVDAVYIAVPNHLHCEYTIKAAKAGVHVLCEKPMAVSEEECRRMIEACEKNDVRLMVAYRLHFDRANLEVIDILQKGEVGDVRFFDSVFTQDVKEGDIRLMPIEKGGGTVYDMGIYAINAARYLFRDEPVRVFANSESPPNDPRFEECDEMTHVTMIFPGQRIATFTSSFGTTKSSMYRVLGTNGEVDMEPAYDYATHLSYKVVRDGETVRAKTFEKRDQFGPELVYFADCILKNGEPEPSGWEGLADVRIIQAIHQSARTGESVEIEPVDVGSRPSLEQAMTRPGFEKPEEFKASGPGK